MSVRLPVSLSLRSHWPEAINQHAFTLQAEQFLKHKMLLYLSGVKGYRQKPRIVVLLTGHKCRAKGGNPFS